MNIVRELGAILNPLDFPYKDKHVIIKPYKELTDHFNLYIDGEFCGTRVHHLDPIQDAKNYIDWGMP
jgi:hypothetical protein